MNKWLLTGRLVKDPETTVTESSNIITVIYVAVRKGFKNKETNEYESDFFRLKAFSKNADYISTYLKKGDLVEIEASPINNNYEKDGQKVYRDEYIVRNISKLSSKKEAVDG